MRATRADPLRPPVPESSGVGVAVRASSATKLAPSTLALEVAAVSVVTAAAFAVRWPELASVPRFTDEVFEIAIGSRIARGQALPLVNVNPFLGSLFNYLVAGALLLVGPRLEAARLVALLCGALTVVPTYLLGRSIGGPLVGLLAAMLVAVSATHIAVNSHIAYANSITPLFLTTGFWLLHRAVSSHSGPHLVGSGLAFGLALQTHPTALVIVPGVALYLLWHGRALIGRWLFLAGVGALLMVANLLVFNFASGFSGLAEARRKSSIGLQGEALTPDAWAGRLLRLLWEFAQGLGGVLSERAGLAPDGWLSVIALVYALLALAGVVALARGGQWLPGLALVSGLLSISLFTSKYAPVVVNSRFYAPLLPLGYVAVAAAVLTFWQRAARIVSPKWIGASAGLAVTLALLAAPIVLLQDYYGRAYRAGNTNLPVLATIDALTRNAQRGEVVYLDHRLGEDLASGGQTFRELRIASQMRRQGHEVFNIEQGGLPAQPERGWSYLLVLHPDTVGLVEGWYRLEPLHGEPGPGAPVRAFRAYARAPS
jgi:4-amino-4-deoxy-L-arabinose transferase-like glycosyltransferase